MLISVVITSYNYEKYLKDTINSVLSQTYTDWEMIVIDDASSDSSVEIIKKYQKEDSRIKLIENETNLGLKKSLEKGVKATSGEWIVFLESDDAITSDYLEKKVAIIKQYPNVGLIFNDVELFGDKKRIKEIEKTFENYANSLKTKIYPTNLFKDLLYFNKVLTLSTVLINKEKLLNLEIFNTPNDKLLDWWMLLHFARKNEFYYIPDKLTKWRIHIDSYIYKKEKKYSYPINLLALINIIKLEKNYKLAIYILPVIISASHRLKVAIIQHIKTILGIKTILIKKNHY